MCLMLYIGGENPLQLKPWIDSKPDSHVSELSHNQKSVKKFFTVPHVRITGSLEKCGCAFNYGREYPQVENDPAELAKAAEARKQLVEYIKRNDVRQIYSCQAGEEAKSPSKFRHI